ncbi:MAG: spermidine synthase [Desulfobulbaceae bacterium]|nr:spermidine synthase [Desulfobulbaceae bacterium]
MTKPWQVIDQAESDEGLLELRQRGEKDCLITIAGRVLMNSSANQSELALSEMACRAMKNRISPRVLIGGLGMAYTLRAALDNLPADARVVVAELNPVVVQWCQGPIAHLTAGAVNDPRVTVQIADVAALIREAATRGGPARFDAIILDLYEGPHRGADEYDHLYGDLALELSGSALTPGGVFAVWSEDPDQDFEQRLRHARFSFTKHRPGRGGRLHVVYIASRTAAPSPRGGSSAPGRKQGRKKT